MKNKKAFTLVEMIGVIVIISLLLTIAIPSILNRIQGSKDDISKKSKEIFYTATDLYLDSHKVKYKNYANNVYCISLQKLVDSEFLTEPVLDVKSGKNIDLQKTVKVTVDEKLNFNHEIVNFDECQEVFFGSPASPELVTGLIPVRWDNLESRWVKADTENPSTQKWYDYTNRLWANAILVTDDSRTAYEQAIPGTAIDEANVLAYFVWIPRYKYKLWNAENGSSNPQAIEIVFENKNVTKSNGDKNNEWLTHPAFTFGDTEVNGIWVGKYETTGTIEELTIKPNLPSLTNQTIGSMFNATRNMEAIGNDYGLSKNNVDSHMMKNTEWGAVAYLSSSIYGRYADGTTCISSGCEVWLNNTNTLTSGSYGPSITGCSGNSVSANISNEATVCTEGYAFNQSGVNAATTGNVTGIYDMSGGTHEYVMANMTNSSGNYFASNSGLNNPGSRYYDSYSYSASSTVNHGRGLLGDSTKETLKTFGNQYGGWFTNDSSSLPYGTIPWITRGGSSSSGTQAGVTSFNVSTGSANTNYGFRIVLVPAQEENLYAETTLNGADPEIYQGMIPITISGEGVAKVADIRTEWYSYSNKEWANAILVDTSNQAIKNKYFNPDLTLKQNIAGMTVAPSDILMYYVWIPRYRYRLFNTANVPVAMQSINIVFENKGTTKSTGSTNNTWLTHPAFTFGNTELNGIWVGKFEMTGTISDITILPDQTAVVSQTVSSFFNAIRQIETINKYGLDQSEVDTHMMKNMEWGAAAYLTQSNYGLCENNNCRTIALNHIQTVSDNTSTITGCSSGVETIGVITGLVCPVVNKWYTPIGQRASTSQNLSGIYDMSGGSWDCVMGMTNDSVGNFYPSGSGFTNAPETKYYDAYSYLASGENSTRGLLGDATRETLVTNATAAGAWNTDYSYFPIGASNYIFRGGYATHTTNAGIFTYYRHNGAAAKTVSTRIVLTAN